jgi:hypothetical protein
MTWPTTSQSKVAKHPDGGQGFLNLSTNSRRVVDADVLGSLMATFSIFDISSLASSAF